MSESVEIYNEIDTLNKKANAVINLLHEAYQNPDSISEDSASWACLIATDLIKQANQKTRKLYTLLKQERST